MTYDTFSYGLAQFFSVALDVFFSFHIFHGSLFLFFSPEAQLRGITYESSRDRAQSDYVALTMLLIRAVAGQGSSPESSLANKTKMHFT